MRSALTYFSYYIMVISFSDGRSRTTR